MSSTQTLERVDRAEVTRGPRLYFGRYRGVAITMVPEEYLRWLVKSPWCHDDIRQEIALHLGVDVPGPGEEEDEEVEPKF